MKLFTMLSILLSLLILSSCGGGSGGGASGGSGGSSQASSFSAKVITIDNNNHVALMTTPKQKFSIFDLIIPKALAALFVDMQPFFAPYYQTFGTPNHMFDCQSLNNSYQGVFCTSAVVSNFSGATATQKNNAIRDALTVYPKIAHPNYAGGLNETVSIANLVEDKYYHFSVTRFGGGVFTGQNVTIDLVKWNQVGGVYESASNDDCKLSIENDLTSQSGGDFIVKTYQVNANDGGNYFDQSFGDVSGNGACYFNIYGTFAGHTLTGDPAVGTGKKIRIGKILDMDVGSSQYPAIDTISFNGVSVTSSEMSIDYADLTNKRSDGYTYADWQLSQNVGGAVSAIDQTYWQFTCGGGGSEGRWMNTVTGNAWNSNHITNKYMEDYQNDVIADTKLFHWRVGFCNEMLMMVSAKDANNNLVQKKVAIISK